MTTVCGTYYVYTKEDSDFSPRVASSQCRGTRTVVARVYWCADPPGVAVCVRQPDREKQAAVSFRARDREATGRHFGPGQDDPMSGAGHDPVSTRGRPRPRPLLSTSSSFFIVAPGRSWRKCVLMSAHVLLRLFFCLLPLRAL